MASASWRKLQSSTCSNTRRIQPHHYVFLARSAPPFDALDAFDNHSARGWSLDAVLITQAGVPDQQPLGIITTFDIPALIAATGGGVTGVG